MPVSSIGAALFMICIAAGAAMGAIINHPAPVIVGGLIGFYLMFAIRVADQWERAQYCVLAAI